MRWLVTVAVLLVAATTVLAQTDEAAFREMFESYVAALEAGDFETALEFWHEDVIASAELLGLEYSGHALKLEVGSPLGEHLVQLASGTCSAEFTEVDLSRGFARISYRVGDCDTASGVSYAQVDADGRPVLVTPLTVFADSWEMLPAEYFTLMYRDHSVLRTECVDFADQFIADVMRDFELSERTINHFRNVKPLQYLCRSVGEMKQLSGSTDPGVFYRPTDAVISRLFPDRHQIAQLLVTYSLDDSPPHTAPLMLRGTATFIGGALGRSSELMLSLGKYLYLNDFTKLDDIMTVAGWEGLESNPDFSYPLAAAFCRFLYERLGRWQYFNLYRALSGNHADIEAITADAFKIQTAAAMETDWQSAEQEFRDWLENYTYKAIEPGATTSGELIYESGVPGVVVQIYDGNTHYHFVAQPDSANFNAAILANVRGESRRYRSFLFREQYPRRDYNQERLAVAFSAQEVGTYDYFTNELTGKYIVGLTGEQPVQSSNGEIRFKIEKRLLPDFARLNKEIISVR
jgi:hypothetical protein